MYGDFFKGKRVTILGLGLLGRSVGDAECIAKCGGRVTVTDLKTHEELVESVARLEGLGVTFHLGGHDSVDFTDTDMVIKSAGVRLDSKEVAAAKAAGVPVYMSTALAAKFAYEMGVKIIGVTGTRGKSTVAHMIHHALVASGSASRRRAHLGGNIRGVSTLAMLPDFREGDVLVLELDSWQLQGFGDLKLSPHIAVFTNLMPDHQNYYPDMDTYFADKANIFRFQKKGDTLIATPELAERIAGIAVPDVYAKHIETPLPQGWGIQMPGEHNRLNAALAAAALEAYGLSEKEIREGLASFGGVEGRLQFVREINGVKIYNDNNATTPEAAIAALQALNVGLTKSHILLIMGGADKGLDMSALVEEVNRSCKAVVFLAGSGTEKVLGARDKVLGNSLEPKTYNLKPAHHGPFNSLNQAVSKALELAEEGDTILFSPAFASFGMFKNEYERNDQFLQIIKNIV